MKINEISVTVDQRIDLDNFEGTAPKVNMSATLEENDDAEKCTSQLFQLAEKCWAKECLRMLRFYRSKREDTTAFDQISAKTVAELKKMLR